MSTYSSEIIDTCLSTIGTTAFFPIKSLNLSSFGFTQIAESPKIVSGLVVAIVTYLSESTILYLT